MHWIERGPEPMNLANLRRRYTGGWIRCYKQETGKVPTDNRWLGYRDSIRSVFHDLCAYCEDKCVGEIEHFRPKSKFPELVYRWSNWLLACSACNLTKRNKWPVGGYVDPCATPWPGQAEKYFRFELDTGEILPKEDLPPESFRKALRTINDLGLNDRIHLEKRLEWLFVVEGAVSNSSGHVDDEGRKYVEFFRSRSTCYSSIARAWLSDRGV